MLKEKYLASSYCVVELALQQPMLVKVPKVQLDKGRGKIHGNIVDGQQKLNDDGAALRALVIRDPQLNRENLHTAREDLVI